MYAQVINLLPGDKVVMPGSTSEAIVIDTKNRHPLHPRLWLVIWRVWPGVDSSPFWSLDALSPLQVVGNFVEPRDEEIRTARLLMALEKNVRAAAKVLRAEVEAREKPEQPRIHEGNLSSWSPEPWEL